MGYLSNVVFDSFTHFVCGLLPKVQGHLPRQAARLLVVATILKPFKPPASLLAPFMPMTPFKPGSSKLGTAHYLLLLDCQAGRLLPALLSCAEWRFHMKGVVLVSICPPAAVMLLAVSCDTWDHVALRLLFKVSGGRVHRPPAGQTQLSRLNLESMLLAVSCECWTLRH